MSGSGGGHVKSNDRARGEKRIGRCARVSGDTVGWAMPKQLNQAAHRLIGTVMTYGKGAHQGINFLSRPLKSCRITHHIYEDTFYP